MRPDLNVKRKVLALERMKAQLDALIAFIKTHPLTAAEGTLLGLPNRTGLVFDDYAMIRPLWIRGKPVLRLYSENWYELRSDDQGPFDFPLRMVREDVSKLSDKKVLALLDKIHRKLLPEDYQNED